MTEQQNGRAATSGAGSMRTGKATSLVDLNLYV